jgi:hypothetical protein
MSFLFQNEMELSKLEETTLSLLNCFRFFLKQYFLNKYFLLSARSWMSMRAGEGEEEIENHGRSRVKRFSQETEVTGQPTPRTGAKGPKLKSLKCRMHTDSPTQLPIFSSFKFVSQSVSQAGRPGAL